MSRARAREVSNRLSPATGVVASLALMAAPTFATSVQAASVAGVAGYEYYDGPGSQLTRGALGAVVVELSGVETSLGGVRYDDSFSGQGVSVTGGLGVPLRSEVMFRAQGTRFVGDEIYRAWRAKVGPQLNMPGGQTMLLWYSHYEDNQDFASDGAILESEIPLRDKLTAKLNGAYATAGQGVRSFQGAVGLGWRMVPHVELSGEVGLARNGFAAAGAGPSVPGFSLPILDGGGPSAQRTGPASEVSPTVLLGMRVSIP